MKTLICDKENSSEMKIIIHDTIKKYKIDYIFISPEFSKIFNNLNVKHDLDKNVIFKGKYLYTLVSDTGERLCGIIVSKHIPQDLCVFADSDGFSVVNLKIEVK